MKTNELTIQIDLDRQHASETATKINTLTTALRREVDSLVLEHDVEGLGALLCRYELDEDLRGLLYAAIDVASNMPLLDVDQICILN